MKSIPIIVISMLSSFLFQNNITKQRPSSKPNILFIPIDDLRPDFETYGHTDLKTPNINRLAQKGVVFTRAYCQQAVCNPSRASLLTGLRPDSLRVWDLQTNMRKNIPEVLTLPQYFRQNGYTTVGLGKTFHNIFPDSLSWTKDIYIKGYPFDPDAMYQNKDNLTIIENKKQKFISENNLTRIDKYGIWYIKAKATENAPVEDNAYYDGVQTTEAINQLKELKASGKPFFLSVGYYKPHLPFNAPKKYWDMYDRNKLKLADNQYIPRGSPAYAVHGDQELRGYDDFRDLPRPDGSSLAEERQRELLHGYYACVSYIDAQIGRLLVALEGLGLAKNTIIVLWGDHGWKLGEHNSWCKQSNYEIDTRVPLIVSGKGVKAKGNKADALVELVDIFPSLCELSGLPIPSNLAGKSFYPILQNAKKTIKDAAYSQFLLGRFPRTAIPNEKMGYAIRTNKYRYVEWYVWDKDQRAGYLESELFDHDTDPKENNNIVKSTDKLILEDLKTKLHGQFFKSKMH
ncbi:MAG: sulfatase [Saprospiraceae bacterium]|nr:sulfatase [Saprospiraceae bacterium]